MSVQGEWLRSEVDRLEDEAARLRGEVMVQQERTIHAEAVAAEYMRRTDPLLLCGDGDEPSSGHCGTCRSCLQDEVRRLRAGCLLAEEREDDACRQLHETELQRDAAREDAERFEREAERLRHWQESEAADFGASREVVQALRKERDEARAEAERLRDLPTECLALLERELHWLASGFVRGPSSAEIRAVVERLRAALGQQKGTPE